MFAKPTTYKTRLTIAPQQSLVEVARASMFPLPGEAEFPSPPALPNALLQLELRLSAPVADLSDITNIIRSDVGLTAQLLRLAAREIEESPDKIVALSEIVVHVGVEKLGALAARTKALPHFSSHAGPSVSERFWMHSRLTALLAEELAAPCCEVSREEAYLAGLLFHLGDLPSLMGWKPASSNAADSRHVGYRMARAWGFPRALADVIGGDREVCLTREARALLDVVTDADTWASRLEFLVARESATIRAKNPPYRLGRG
jgi:HD-like signal output (HDOD) protein